MPILRLLRPSIRSPAWNTPQLRWLHSRKGGTGKAEAPPPTRGLSLLEELFPEEIKDHRRGQSKQTQIPRLRLPDVDQGESKYAAEGHFLRGERSLASFVDRNSLRQWNLSVLVLRRASKSLVESDFRRIAPKGQHIDDWKGPGEILQVIPARDPSSLQQLGHYFLLFPNPAYARAYQSHVISLHRISKTHTPTSIESPLPPPPGMLIEGENIHEVLQKYALCPPSQKISLRILFPPYSPRMQRLMDQRGYSQIVSPSNRSGRAVLVWVQGYQPSLSAIRDLIDRDGQDRGLAWALARGETAIEKVEPPATDNETMELNARSRYVDNSQQTPSGGRRRWIVSFTDEYEARRFTRHWHRRPFPLRGEVVAVGEPPPLMNAELIW